MFDPEQNLITGLQEVLPIEKESAWGAVYPSRFMPKRAYGRVRRINPTGEQAHNQGTNAFTARIARLRICAKAGCQHS